MSLDPLLTFAAVVVALVAMARWLATDAPPAIKLGSARQETIRQRLLENAP